MPVRRVYRALGHPRGWDASPRIVCGDSLINTYEVEVCKEDGNVITRALYLEGYIRGRKIIDFSESGCVLRAKAAREHSHSYSDSRDTATTPPPRYIAI